MPLDCMTELIDAVGVTSATTSLRFLHTAAGTDRAGSENGNFRPKYFTFFKARLHILIH